MTQLTLFGDADIMKKLVVRASGGSGNPIIFRDYESYIAKFADKEKTTDDTFHILISKAKAMEKEECERKAHRNIPVPLSPREQKIVECLGKK